MNNSKSILERLELELKEKNEKVLDTSYNVRLSKELIKILNTNAKMLGIKQSELIRLCIENLPMILKGNY